MSSGRFYTLLFVLGIALRFSLGEGTSTRATPNWPGVFDAADGCDKKTCCCPSGSITLRSVESDQLHVQAPFDGACGPTSFTVDSTIAMPKNFSAVVIFLTQIISINLSEDSRQISFFNPVFSDCDGVAIRKNNAISLTGVNFNLLALASVLVVLKQLWLS